jgi:hypothetical protein
MSAALDALQANYFDLTENFDDYLERCKNSQEEDALKAAYQQARLDFYNARNKAFAANDPDIQKAVDALKAAQDSLKKMTDELADIAKVINAVTTVVKLGTELAKLGA